MTGMDGESVLIICNLLRFEVRRRTGGG